MKRERLIQERKKRNKTRKDTAKEIMISEVYVRMIENGTANPGRNTMLKFSKYYGLGLKTLFPDLFDAGNDKKVIKKGA